MKTATTLASELKTEAKLINQSLIMIGFMFKGENGYVSKHSLGVSKEHNGKSFVLWNDEILTNKLFLDKVEELKNKTTETNEKLVEVEKKEVTFLSATQIAKELEIKPTQVNAILVNIHFMDKLGEGYNSNHVLAKQLMHEKTPYVKWSSEILTNAVFLREVNSLKSCKEEFEKEVKETILEEKKSTEKSETEAFKFDRKTFDATLRTQSGHFVRSRAEVIVADWLYNNDIMFAYEKRLPIVEELYSDFFIKKGKVYIEVWGLESTKYLERKAKKIEMYKQNGYTLIGLEDKDIENLDDYLPLKLAQVGFIF
jgi:very-short-patch-repair endonuclease